MAKKTAKEEVVKEEAKKEKIIEKPPMLTMIDQNGYTWEVDGEGNPIRRI